MALPVNIDSVFTNIRLVVLDVAGLEYDDFNFTTDVAEALLFSPALKGLRGEVGKLFVTVDPKDLFEKPSVRGNTVHHIREAERCSSGFRGCIWITKDTVAQLEPLVLRANRFVAVQELGEVQLKFMFVPGGIGALNFAELALEALINQLVFMRLV